VQYEAQTMQAPKVVAKGAHRLAERIVEIARRNQVPIVQNVPLARALYRLVDLDQEIPPQLYMAMAEVLAYVYRLRQGGAVPQSRDIPAEPDHPPSAGETSGRRDWEALKAAKQSPGP